MANVTTLARAVRSAGGRANSRNARVRAIMAACRRNGIDDDFRYDIIESVTGKRSTKLLTLPELGKVLDRLNQGRKRGTRPVHGKIRALWWTCYWVGAIDHGGDTMDHALDAFVQRQTGIAALRFLTHDQSPQVIEALKAMAARQGVVWPCMAQPQTAWRDAERAPSSTPSNAITTATPDRTTSAAHMPSRGRCAGYPPTSPTGLRATRTKPSASSAESSADLKARRTDPGADPLLLSPAIDAADFDFAH